MSLSHQINSKILLSALVILLLSASITVWHAKQAINSEIEASVKMVAHIISCGFSQTVAYDATWLNCINTLDETRHLKIRLLKPNGEILDLAKKHHILALTDQPPTWFINLIGGAETKIEMPVITTAGEQFSLSIQANPLDEIREVWEESLGFLSTLIGLTLFAFLSVYLALRQSLKSIGSIVNALQDIETGQYRQILPEFSTLEYNSIAKAINHMTHELETAQQENRKLTQHSLTILEIERQQLARELHDELGQSLTAIKMMALAANRKPSEIKAMTENIAEICDNLVDVVRTMTHQLHPLVLTELGLKAALDDLIIHWSDKHPALKLRLTCCAAIDQINPNIAIQVFRVIQECLTNIIRHAQASEASVSLTIEKGANPALHLCVKDNGKGTQLHESKKGFGLLAMKERIQSLGGTFSVLTGLGQGFVLSAHVPTQNVA